MELALKHLKRNTREFVEDLKNFVAFPSISTDPAFGEQLALCRLFLEEHLRERGIRVRMLETGGIPALFAEGQGPPDAPTLLIYGHYDVQPARREDGWDSEPFKLTKTDGRWVARGVADNKGPLLALIKAVECCMKGEGLPVSVKFLIEGEEEIASKNLEACIADNKDLLKADSVLISDSLWVAPETPSLCYSLRGIVYAYIRVEGPAMDLHSGVHGGVVSNPHMKLAHLLATLVKADGTVALEGFYDQVRPLSEEERKQFSKVPLDVEAYRTRLGVEELLVEDKVALLARRWAEPTFEVHGITGGYTGPGAKTIVPAYAEAKVSMRLVPDQEPETLFSALEEHIERHCPEANIMLGSAAPPFLASATDPYYYAARTAMKAGFGSEPLLVREGGSIPAALYLKDHLQVPVVLIPICAADDNPHSPNEKFEVSHFESGIKTFIAYLHEVARLGGG
jgi:acetylornithine deacetylase/succinyl-diaminopimelate desuccinylase-like protein